MIKSRDCELCSAKASVFCPSDNAFLCHTCDSKVHDANFLVARHIRQPICDNYVKEEDDESSACISSTTKEMKNSNARKNASSVNEATSQRKVLGRYEADDIFENWCGKLGVGDDVVVRRACGALRVCLDKWKFLPFRVGLAASMWLGLRVVGGVIEMGGVLKRLEEVSGVPSKVILAAESKVARAIRSERRRSRLVDLEEGWAEC